MASTRLGGCWPTPVQELLLGAALADGDAARTAFAAWAASAGYPNVDEGSVRLLPLLYRNVARLGLSSPLVDELKGVHRRSWYKNQVLFQEATRVLASLHQAGIETLLLKGVPLALQCYPDEASRPMADVDILVKPTDVVPAVDVLRRGGWVPTPEPEAWPAEPRNAWTFIDRQAREIDLHWRVFRVGYSLDEDLWDGSERLIVKGEQTRALCPADQLLHVVAHGLVWNPVPAIRWVADATLLVRARGAAIDWARVAAQAEARRVVPAVSLGLRYLADRFEVPVPAEVLARLEAHQMSRGERLGLWAQMSPGIVAGAIRLGADYLAYERGAGAKPGPVRFWRYLRAFWRAEGGRSVPAMIADRVRHRARR